LTPIQITRREFIKSTLTGVGILGLGLGDNAFGESNTEGDIVPEKDIIKAPISPKINKDLVPESVIADYEANSAKVLALKPGEKLEKGVIVPLMKGQDGRIYYHALINLRLPVDANTYTGLSDALVYVERTLDEREDVNKLLIYAKCPQLIGASNRVLNCAIIVDFFGRLYSMDGEPSELQANGVYTVKYQGQKLELVLGSDGNFHIAKKFDDSIGWEEISGTPGVGLSKDVSELGVQQFLDQYGFLKGERIKGSSWKPLGKYNRWRNIFVFEPSSKEGNELQSQWENILYLKPSVVWEGPLFRWVIGKNARVFFRDKSVDSLLWKCVHDGEWYIEQEKGFFVWLGEYKAPSGRKYLVDSSLNMYDITSGKKLKLPERARRSR